MRKYEMFKRYRHFKGFEVTVLGFATHTETGEKMVIYHCDSHKGTSHQTDSEGIYVRPLSMFVSPVDRKKYPNAKQQYRFEEIS